MKIIPNNNVQAEVNGNNIKAEATVNYVGLYIQDYTDRKCANANILAQYIMMVEVKRNLLQK